jgi:hypothetical protein
LFFLFWKSWLQFRPRDQQLFLNGFMWFCQCPQENYGEVPSNIFRELHSTQFKIFYYRLRMYNMYGLRRIVNTFCSSRQQTACFKATEGFCPLVPPTYPSPKSFSFFVILQLLICVHPPGLLHIIPLMMAVVMFCEMSGFVHNCYGFCRKFITSTVFMLLVSNFTYCSTYNTCPLNNLKIFNDLKISIISSSIRTSINIRWRERKEICNRLYHH